MTSPDSSEIIVLILTVLAIMAVAWAATRRGIDED